MRKLHAAIALAVLVAAALRWWSASIFGAQGSSCQSVPNNWLEEYTAEDDFVGGDKYKLTFLLLWSTDAASFNLRARRCIESIVYHHPKARVLVFSNKLPSSTLQPFSAQGYDVRVIRFRVKQLLKGTPAEAWLSRLDEWKRGPYYYSHLTDALRLALLFRHGGVYLDTDVILTRPLFPWVDPNYFSHTYSKSTPPPPPPEKLRPLRDSATVGLETYAAPRTGLPTLNGAVMVFDLPGSRFLWNCMHEFARNYYADRWSWNGPELLTRVQARCEHTEGATVQVEPPSSFYPLHWEGIADRANGKDPEGDSKAWEAIQQRSYAVHVWNRKTAELPFAESSLLYRLHNTWMVLPEREKCT